MCSQIDSSLPPHVAHASPGVASLPVRQGTTSACLGSPRWPVVAGAAAAVSARRTARRMLSRPAALRVQGVVPARRVSGMAHACNARICGVSANFTADSDLPVAAARMGSLRVTSRRSRLEMRLVANRGGHSHRHQLLLLLLLLLPALRTAPVPSYIRARVRRTSRGYLALADATRPCPRPPSIRSRQRGQRPDIAS